MFCSPSIQESCLLDLRDVLIFTCELSFIKNVYKRILQLALSLNMTIFYQCLPHLPNPYNVNLLKNSSCFAVNPIILRWAGNKAYSQSVRLLWKNHCFAVTLQTELPVGLPNLGLQYSRQRVPPAGWTGSIPPLLTVLRKEGGRAPGDFLPLKHDYSQLQEVAIGLEISAFFSLSGPRTNFCLWQRSRWFSLDLSRIHLLNLKWLNRDITSFERRYLRMKSNLLHFLKCT